MDRNRRHLNRNHSLSTLALFRRDYLGGPFGCAEESFRSLQWMMCCVSSDLIGTTGFDQDPSIYRAPRGAMGRDSRALRDGNISSYTMLSRLSSRPL